MRIHGLDWSFQLNPFWTKIFILVTVGFVFLVLFIQAKNISRYKWQCPNCNQTFIPRWYRCLFSPHIGSDQILRCPHCGKKNFCWRAEHGEEENS